MNETILKINQNKFIRSEFEQYKIFIGLDLPRFEIMYKENNSWAYFNSEDLYNKEYIFHVDPQLFNNRESFIKSALYHEFTHLYDSINCFKYNDLKAFTSFMDTYSEYHASKIQTMKLFNFSSLDQKIQIAVTSSCAFESRNVTMQEYINYYLDKCKKEFEISDLSKFVSDFRNIMYLCGITDFYISYCDEAYEEQFDPFQNSFDAYFLKIYKVLKAFDPMSYCKKLIELRQKLNNLYVTNFKMQAHEKLFSDLLAEQECKRKQKSSDH